MSLKTATLIALLGTLAQSFLWLLQTFNVIELTADSAKLYSIANLFLGNGSMLLFLAVLYSKQKKTGGE